jgi:putative NADH-flavin reductase
MRIAVIAANGRSGRAFVSFALESGHTISAGVRHASTMEPHERLELITCDATQKDELKRLCKDCDVVVSFIGHVRGSTADVQTVAMKNCIKVMEELNITRLVSLTGTGIRFEGDKIPLIDKILNVAIKVIDPKRIKDGKNHATILKKSTLDWTLIRALKLQNSEFRPYELLEHGPPKIFCSRAEVAHATLEVIEKKSFIKKAPIIGNPRTT